MRTSGGLKVSVRRTESYERVAEQPTTFPEMRLGYITDREGDIAVLMRRADELGHLEDGLIRSQHYHKLDEVVKLWQTVEACAVMGGSALSPRTCSPKGAPRAQRVK